MARDDMTVEISLPDGKTTGPIPAADFERRAKSALEFMKLKKKRRKESMRDPIQKPLEQWTENQLATAGVELAERLTELRRMEDSEKERRSEYKEEHEAALEALHALKQRVEEQKASLGD